MLLQQRMLLVNLILSLRQVIYHLMWRCLMLYPALQMQRCSPIQMRELILNMNL